jgi:hypothetical protein
VRHFEIASDEAHELLDQNTVPNSQELRLAALNACLSVGDAAKSAAMGITVHSGPGMHISGAQSPEVFRQALEDLAALAAESCGLDGCILP